MSKNIINETEKFIKSQPIIYNLLDKKYYFKYENNMQDIFSTEGINLIRRKVFKVTEKMLDDKNIKIIVQMVISDQGESGDIQICKLYNRIAGDNLSIMYAHYDKENSVSIIDSEGIKKSYNNSFIPNKNALPQVLPVEWNDKEIFEKHFLNIPTETRTMYLIFLIARFIPDIEQPILFYMGDMGSAKSTTAVKEKKLIDPSTSELKFLPEKLEDFAVALNSGKLTVFDNVSKLSKDQSNMLCLASTGGEYSKRTLYTDGEMTVIPLKTSVSMTGIESCMTKADLLDRTIFIKLKRIKEENNISKKEIFENYEKDLPYILGYTFSMISSAIKIYNSDINIKPHGRLVDHYKWCYCIAEAMGHGGERFAEEFKLHKEYVNEVTLSEDILGELIPDYMKGKAEIELIVSDLYDQLKALAESQRNLDLYPKTANIFGKRINEISVNLEKKGLKVERFRKNKNRMIKITNSNPELLEGENKNILKFPIDQRTAN